MKDLYICIYLAYNLNNGKYIKKHKKSCENKSICSSQSLAGQITLIFEQSSEFSDVLLIILKIS